MNKTESIPQATPQGSGATHHQIALFTKRIKHLTGHLQKHKKDYSSKRGLHHFVSKRSRLLRYLKRVNVALYLETCQKLKLRK